MPYIEKASYKEQTSVIIPDKNKHVFMKHCLTVIIFQRPSSTHYHRQRKMKG